MPSFLRLLSALVVLLLSLSALRAQQKPDSPPFEPVKKPSRKDLDAREARLLFGLGIQYQHHNRLTDAVQAFEQALQLDPEAAEPRRALVPLYLALDRPEDARKVCKEIVKLDPHDFDTWFVYARQLRTAEKLDEATSALEKALACPGLKEKPELHVLVSYELGVLYEQSKVLDKAEKAFREAAELLGEAGQWLDTTPANKEEIAQQTAETWERIGRICLQGGHTDRAVSAFEHALKSDPGRASRLAYNLAEVFAAKNKPTEALKHLDVYLTGQPPAVEGYELKIKLQRQLGQEKQIVPALETYVQNDPHNKHLPLLLAREYRTANQTDKARGVYNKLIQTEPTAEAFRGLFELLKTQRGGYADILQRVEKALKDAADEEDEKRPPGPMATAATSQARAMLVTLRQDKELVKELLPLARQRLREEPPLNRQTRLLLATLALRAGHGDEAEHLYRSCLDSKGKVVQVPGLRNVEQEVYGGLLRVLAQAHKSKEIVDLCKQGLDHSEATNRVMFYLDMARAQAQLGETEASLKSIDLAVEHAAERDQLVCRCVKADLLARADKTKEAVAECEAMFKLYSSPKDVRGIRYTLSSVYSAAQQQDKSEEQLQAILKEDANDATANNDLGYLWADQNRNLDEAEKMIRKALELDERQRKNSVGLDSDQETAAYIDSLAWVLFRKGQLDEARKLLEKAVTLSGGHDDPVVWDHLGDVCYRQKKSARAIEAWKKAIECYEAGYRRKSDNRYKDIEQKLKQLTSTNQQQ